MIVLDEAIPTDALQAYSHCLHHSLVNLGWVIGTQLCIYTFICHNSRQTFNFIYTSDKSKSERLSKIIESNVEANRVVRELLRRSNGIMLRIIIASPKKSAGLNLSAHLGKAEISHLGDMLPIA